MGHVVAVSGRLGMLPRIEAAGFMAFPSGPDGGDSDRKLPLLPPSAEREDQVLRDGFAGRLAKARATSILNLCASWNPDIVVCDEVDFGAMVAAERLGLPHANVIVIAAGGFIRTDLVSDTLNELRADNGLPPDPDLTMLGRYLVLASGPPSYRDPAHPLPGTAHAIRPLIPAPAEGDELPVWVTEWEGGPLVYFTLGTVFNVESGDLFARVVNGLRDLPIRLVVTVGRQIDPAELGSQPANVRIERFIPQALLLPHCDLVVSHGGSGSVIGALAHGLPMVLIPMGADQFLNGARCAALGIARVLDPVTTTPQEVAGAVSDVLANPTWRRNAERLQAEIADLPGPDHAVTLLVQLFEQLRERLLTEAD
jgi:UDP:flavonoid glycosyltransferase YjiC (YdhE family)